MKKLFVAGSLLAAVLALPLTGAAQENEQTPAANGPAPTEATRPPKGDHARDRTRDTEAGQKGRRAKRDAATPEQRDARRKQNPGAEGSRRQRDASTEGKRQRQGRQGQRRSNNT